MRYKNWKYYSLTIKINSHSGRCAIHNRICSRRPHMRAKFYTTLYMGYEKYDLQRRQLDAQLNFYWELMRTEMAKRINTNKGFAKTTQPYQCCISVQLVPPSNEKTQRRLRRRRQCANFCLHYILLSTSSARNHRPHIRTCKRQIEILPLSLPGR